MKKFARIAACTMAAMMVFAPVVANAEDNSISACIITTTGVDDGSFNTNVYEGMTQFAEKYPDSTITDVKQEDLTKCLQTVEDLVGDYDVLVLPGFEFAAIGDIAEANPEKDFILVDTTATYSDGTALNGPLDNIYSMTFKEQEGGFFAGVAAALSTETGKVAVVNGIAYPSNVNYQFGFMAGVNYANAKYGTAAEYVELPSYSGMAAVPVEALAVDGNDGTDVGGNYIGDFGDQAKGKEVGKALIDAGCDVIFVAAGGAGNGVFTAMKEAGTGYIIGCDVDQYEDGENGDSNIILTSALKIMDKNVCEQLTKIHDGSFKGEDALLGADTDSTGYVAQDGHQQLSKEALEKLTECFAAVKDGTVFPPSNFNGGTPTYFPGLK